MKRIPLQRDMIYNVGCEELMDWIPEESIDLIIADPPYNIGKDFDGQLTQRDFYSWINWTSTWLRRCKERLTDNGQMFVFASHRFACFVQCILYQFGMKYRRQIIWYYENGMSRQVKEPITMYEPILWFSKSDEFTYHTIREPYKDITKERMKAPIIKNGKVWKPHPLGRKAGDVWRVPVLAGRRFAAERVDHPTQKPLQLVLRMVRHFSNEGDRVFVPFAGSGSECVACKLLGRSFIASETSLKYVRIANERIEGCRNPVI